MTGYFLDRRTSKLPAAVTVRSDVAVLEGPLEIGATFSNTFRFLIDVSHISGFPSLGINVCEASQCFEKERIQNSRNFDKSAVTKVPASTSDFTDSSAMHGRPSSGWRLCPCITQPFGFWRG